MKVSTVEQMRALDRRAIEEFGIPAQILMENAGNAAYFVVLKKFGIAGKRFLVFAGIGNNGGDGCVPARVSSSPILIQNYSQNLWGRTIKTLYHVKRSDAEEFTEAVRGVKMKVGTTIFPLDELPGALIKAKHGELDQPNAVIQVSQ